MHGEIALKSNSGKILGRLFKFQGVPRPGILHEIGKLLSMELSLLEESVDAGWLTPLHLAYSESVGERRDKRKPAIRRGLNFLCVTPLFVCVVWDKFGHA